MIGLAKREEEIIIKKKCQNNIVLNKDYIYKQKGFIKESADFVTIRLPKSSHVQLCYYKGFVTNHIGLRVSYHSSLRSKQQTQSSINQIPGIGRITIKKLLKQFGSINGIKSANKRNLVELVGKQKAELIINWLV